MGASLKELQAVARVVQNGRVTLPIEIRETLGIKDGDKVLMVISKIEE
jgi:AbrB family looped-hinge helix DNA binding protein